MKTLLQPLFLTACALFGINQLLEFHHIFLPYVHAYLDDVLCFPIVLTLILFLFRTAILKDPNFCLSSYQIAFAVAYFAFAFEEVLPYFSSEYTSDVLDVVFYAIGGGIFGKWMQ